LEELQIKDQPLRSMASEQQALGNQDEVIWTMISKWYNSEKIVVETKRNYSYDCELCNQMTPMKDQNEDRGG